MRRSGSLQNDDISASVPAFWYAYNARQFTGGWSFFGLGTDPPAAKWPIKRAPFEIAAGPSSRGGRSSQVTASTRHGAEDQPGWRFR